MAGVLSLYHFLRKFKDIEYKKYHKILMGREKDV